MNTAHQMLIVIEKKKKKKSPSYKTLLKTRQKSSQVQIEQIRDKSSLKAFD